MPTPGVLEHELRAAVTRRPRRYGLHGTLQPPMVPAEGIGAGEIGETAAEVAAGHRPVSVPLEPGWLGPWLVLHPAGRHEAVQALGDDLVRALHPMRRPPPPDELERRRAAGLTPRQAQLLARWGYPLVFDEFHLHLTLAGPVDPADRAAVEELARSWFQDEITPTLVLDDVALVQEDRPGGAFRVVRRLPLGPT